MPLVSPRPTQSSRSPAKEILSGNVILGRARARLSQEALADRAGVSRPTISRIERSAEGDVSLETIERIAHALGIAVAELFVPAGSDAVDDREIRRRANAADDEFIDAEVLIDAIEEARPTKYSNAGRKPVSR
jgi:transcriptional regulator with XRE-family HTH domain